MEKGDRNRMKIGIIGHGYVGKAMERFFKDHYELVLYDPPAGYTTTKDDINSCDVSFVCVPTPKDEDGSCDISMVEDTLEWLDTEIIVIKSTVFDAGVAPPNKARVVLEQLPTSLCVTVLSPKSAAFPVDAIVI